MPSINQDTSLKQLQSFIEEVYSLNNDRHYDIADMLGNIQRFAMRGLKGIRKGNIEKAKKNLIISSTWFISTLNRLHIDLEEEVWRRFPNLCSYCGARPCSCKAQKLEARQDVPVVDSQRPVTMADFQLMFSGIYPPASRSLEHAGVHLAEEIGEFSEALLAYRGERAERDFREVVIEAADYFSCLMGVFNSMKLDFSLELSKMFLKNCHECLSAPCACSYINVKKYES